MEHILIECLFSYVFEMRQMDAHLHGFPQSQGDDGF